MKLTFQIVITDESGPVERKNHGSLAAANRGVAEYELSE